MNISDFEKYLTPGTRAHLVGIGGVSMAPLAEELFGMGLVVTGSDINESDTVKNLRALGIEIAIGHDAANVSGAQVVVRTAAARDDNVEIAAARETGIPVFERAQAWGCIMRGYKNAVCVSGTHGKTTTTSMITQILLSAGLDPTAMIGGTLPILNSGHRVGNGDTIVMESCEYYNSFHSFSPTVAVVLNIDSDHLDFFKDIEAIKASFRHFASLVPETGHVVYNGDDKNTVDALAGLDRHAVTFGFSDGCDMRAENVVYSGTRSSFDAVCRGELFARIELGIPGEHNVKNALAACAVSWLLGVDPAVAASALAEFSGACRRFEFKGKVSGADVYDDYAHHPGELKALLDMALGLGYRRVIVAFQPHTYSRTAKLFDEFVGQLSRADMVFLAEIYAAREKNTIGISSKDLAGKIDGAVFCPTLPELEEALRSTAGEGDLILTVGAGNIYTVGEHITAG